MWASEPPGMVSHHNPPMIPLHSWRRRAGTHRGSQGSEVSPGASQQEGHPEVIQETLGRAVWSMISAWDTWGSQKIEESPLLCHKHGLRLNMSPGSSAWQHNAPASVTGSTQRELNGLMKCGPFILQADARPSRRTRARPPADSRTLRLGAAPCTERWDTQHCQRQRSNALLLVLSCTFVFNLIDIWELPAPL